ncbi:hypothetical protein EBU91_01320 [bacterium]|nr:hypothetical protein [bacterium]
MLKHQPVILIIDDDSIRHAQFVKNNPDCVIHSVYTCDEATAAIYDQHYDMICFDHDLGYSEKNGYETSIPFAKTVRGLIDTGGILESTIMLVHSSNPVGAQDILSYFARTPNESFKVPWAWSIPKLFNTVLFAQERS